MHTQKIIIHRLHVPRAHRDHVRRIAGGLLQAFTALAGTVVLIAALSAA